MQTHIGHNIEYAQDLLKQGKLVAIPTETVYGLAANALDAAAVIKIFEAKNRPQFNPLIVHIKSWDEAGKYVQDIPAKANLLAQKLTPGPITFLLPKKSIIPDIICSGSPLVAIRVPKHPVTAALLNGLDFPLAAPSANEFGYISPTLASHVLDSLDGKIDYILDGAASSVGVESTIVGFDEHNRVVLHRAGGVGVEVIEEILGEKVLFVSKKDGDMPQTSGQLKSHYAPRKPLYIGDLETLSQQFAGKKIASISFVTSITELETVQQFILSPKGILAEAATRLFQVMREIDKSENDIIIAELFPDEGLGKAINDRLARAQAIFK